MGRTNEGGFDNLGETPPVICGWKPRADFLPENRARDISPCIVYSGSREDVAIKADAYGWDVFRIGENESAARKTLPENADGVIITLRHLWQPTEGLQEFLTLRTMYPHVPFIVFSYEPLNMILRGALAKFNVCYYFGSVEDMLEEMTRQITWQKLVNDSDSGQSQPTKTETKTMPMTPHRPKANWMPFSFSLTPQDDTGVNYRITTSWQSLALSLFVSLLVVVSLTLLINYLIVGSGFGCR